MKDRPICQARTCSGEFIGGPCFNYAKAERYGLHVCNVHKKQLDRLADGHGEDYGLAVVRLEWKRGEAAHPRVRPEVLA